MKVRLENGSLILEFPGFDDGLAEGDPEAVPVLVFTCTRMER
ncbi:hypothetical protein ACIRBY_25270 [Streptomyces sp. NPDC096136]